MPTYCTALRANLFAIRPTDIRKELDRVFLVGKELDRLQERRWSLRFVRHRLLGRGCLTNEIYGVYLV